jgi:acyl-CoA dehydrogenase
MNPLNLLNVSTALKPEERDLLNRVIDFCKKEVAPHCEKWEKDENLPREIFTKAGQLGLLGITAPKQYGGLGMSMVAYSLIVIEMSKYYAALALDIAAHNALALGHLLAAGNEEQKKAVAPKLAKGEWLGAWALTEPNAGSDSGGMETVGEFKNGKWSVTGHKTFITQGSRGDVYIVMASTGVNEKGRKEISAFLVRKEHVKPIRKIYTYGMKASDTAELRFENAPAELLGEKAHGQDIALAMLERGRIGVASLAVGIGIAAYDAAAQYSLQRKQFGKAIAEFEAVQWMLADSATELDAALLLTLRAATLQDQGQKTPKESAMAKLYSAEAADRVCNRAMQIHGGKGYSRDLPVERYLRDVKLCEIGEGTSEIQRIVISRHILKEAQAH